MRPKSLPTQVLVTCRDPLFAAALAFALRSAGFSARTAHPKDPAPRSQDCLVVEAELMTDWANTDAKIVALVGPRGTAPQRSDAVVRRTASLDRLIEAVRSLAPTGLVAESTASYDAGEDLTNRQSDIAELIRRGYKNVEIAAELGLQEQTVKNTVSRMMKKRGLRNRIELIRWLESRALWSVSEGPTA